jgi:hypothetical protein
MNNFGLNQYSSSGSFDLSGIFAAFHLASEKNISDNPTPPMPNPPFVSVPYLVFATPATFDQCRTTLMGEYRQERTRFENDITGFYAKLLSSQEPLEESFEKVLYENVWDLYEAN